ncbi:MAG: YfhO family protein [Ruminococcus sp.]|nr:YfhO family protein [Ruminococcus sp.]
MKDNKTEIKKKRAIFSAGDRKGGGVLVFLLSFMIPVVIMLYAFSKELIHPFGSNQILVVDCWHQYYPFFRVVWEKLRTGGSFLYSWQNGMGTNFLSLISYYAASPLNWISAFFSEERTRDVFTLILVAKIGFSGGFFSLFLRYIYRRSELSMAAFSAMFALCSYMLGYYWNVMWFDTIALLPLVMTGLAALCREGKWKLYVLALFLALVSNYYIGYFICIFSAFMFLVFTINEGVGVKKFFSRLGLMTISSLVGGCLGGFMLLPAYFGLQMTYSVNNTFPAAWSTYEKWTDIFANLISYNEPAMKEGLPNFACGMLAIVLFGVFLFSGGIKIREKITYTLMLAFIAVSCNLNRLNFIWHGFHATNQIPYRFAFLFSFLLIAAAYRAYDVMTEKGIKWYQLVLLLVAPCAVFALNYLKDRENFEFTGAIRSSVIITAAYVLVFIAAKLWNTKNHILWKSCVSICLIAAVVAELTSNALIGAHTVGSSGYISYPTKYAQAEELLDLRETYDNPLFYRTEMTSTYTLNDSALYGYVGVSQFSSAANVSVTTFLKRMGLYASEAGNRYYYRQSTPVVNSLLGIKYLISRNGPVRSVAMSLDYKAESSVERDTVYLYENRYPLSLGFMVSSDILDMEDSADVNPFEYQNKLMSLACSLDGKLYTPQPVALVKYENISVEKESYGKYSFTTEDGGNPVVTYTFDGVDGSYLYGYVKGSGVENLNLRSCGTTIDNNVSIGDYSITFPLGDAQSGDNAEIVMNIDKSRSKGDYNVVAYALDEERFRQAYDTLADEQLDIKEFSDTLIKGSIDVKNDGVMFLSVPYEKGWSVYSDGQETETFPVAGAMLGVKLPSGHHEITMKYKPEGFTAGLLASGASAVMFLLMALAERVIRRRKKETSEEAPGNSAETASVSPEQGISADTVNLPQETADAIPEQESAGEIPPENGDNETTEERSAGEYEE